VGFLVVLTLLFATFLASMVILSSLDRGAVSLRAGPFLLMEVRPLGPGGGASFGLVGPVVVAVIGGILNGIAAAWLFRRIERVRRDG